MQGSLKQLSILQINVGRSWAAHETALQLAFLQHFHVVLIQEPWVFADHSRRLSKHHPAFSQLSPVEDWKDRPRVLTYIQQLPLLSAAQVPVGPPCQDLLAISISSSRQSVLLVNIYNAPTGSIDEHQGLAALFSTTIPSLPCMLAGDFNLRHPSWQTTGPTSTKAAPFLTWAVNQQLSLTLPPNTPTHGPNMIDLVWANSALCTQGVLSEVPDDLPPLADHEPIITSINWGSPRQTRQNPPLRWSTFDDALFQQTLSWSCMPVHQSIAELSHTPSSSQLDRLTTAITDAIMTAVEAATRQAYPQPSGHQWWTEECSAAVQALQKTT